jgi:hypothetical protein
MTNPTPLPARLTVSSTLRGMAMAGFSAGLVLSLQACKNGVAAPLSPAGAALAASAPSFSAAHVPPPPTIASGAAAAGDLASVDAKLDTMLANASACTVDPECHSVAVGAKACGGPTGYRAYSSKTVSSASVDALAQQQRDLAAQAARASHQVSTCYMLGDPGAHCEKNKCATGPAGPG